MFSVGLERFGPGRDGRISLSACGPGSRTTAATMMPAAAAPAAQIHGVLMLGGQAAEGCQ